MSTRQPHLERFFDKVIILPDFGCWYWTAGKDRDGYGKFSVDGRSWRAHRWIAQEMVAPVPPDHDVEHSCFNVWCVNFARCLKIVDKRGNWLTSRSLARLNALKTECLNEHPFDQENTYWYIGGNGRWARGCRKCRNRRSAEGRQRVMAS